MIEDTSIPTLFRSVSWSRGIFPGCMHMSMPVSDWLRSDETHSYKSRSPPSSCMSQPTLWRSDVLCYGQTPFPPICILVLKPLSLWLRLVLHTMGMEGGLDQCSGIHHQPWSPYLLQNRVTLKTLIMITHSIDYIRMIVCMNRPCNAVVVFNWGSCAQKNGASKPWQTCMKGGASALHCAASSTRGLLQ